MIRRNRLLAWAGTLLLAGSAVAAVAAETPREEVKRLVDEGVALVAQKGLAGACNVFAQRNSEFWHGDTYVYVINTDKRWVCYPLKPALVGQSPVGLLDTNGGDTVSDQVKLARSPAGEGWVGYIWPNPATGKVQDKESFVKLVPGTDLMVIAGYYK